MISLLLDHAKSLRPNIPQDFMSFHESTSADSTRFPEGPTFQDIIPCELVAISTQSV